MRGRKQGRLVRWVGMPGRSHRGTSHLVAGLVVLGISGALFAPVTADAHPVTNFLIVPGRSIGGVKLGERRASVRAISGPGKKFESPRDLIFYKHLQLLVDYVGGRVAGVEASSTIYKSAPVVDAYQTASNFGLADSFNEFVHAFRRYHRHCKSGFYMGGTNGRVPFTATRCIVVAPSGDFTVFGFAGPDTAIPACLGITVDEKSQLAEAESAPLV
jgi:hypothetical protein